MDSRSDNKVGGYITGLKNNRSRSGYILEHPISDVGEYVRKLYIDALCVIAQYANEGVAGGLAFVKRIHSESGLKNEFSEHIKNAMNITSEKLEEFFAQCKENALEHIFVLDCLLIAGADGVPNSKQITFVVKIFVALGMTKEQISLISELAVSILERDNNKYRKVCEIIPADAVMNILGAAMCYVRQFVSGVLIDTDEIFCICFNEQTFFDFDKNNYRYINGHTKIIIENACIETNLIIKNCERLVLRKCRFSNRINFLNIGLVNVEYCEFDMLNRIDFYYIFWVEGVGSLFMDRCNISNVLFERRNSSGVFKIESCSELTVNSSLFINIHKQAYNTIIAGEIPEKSKITVSDCLFDNCLHYNLFANGTALILEKNEYRNCCKIFLQFKEEKR